MLLLWQEQVIIIVKRFLVMGESQEVYIFGGLWNKKCMADEIQN